MTQPAKQWSETTPAEKRAGVKDLMLQGIGYTKIADIMGAPNRHCVAGVVTKLRQMGELPPTPSKQQTGAAGGAVVRAKARIRREKGATLHAGNIANKAESRKADPELKVRRVFAFDPLPGIEPVPFVPNTGCKWAVDGVDGAGMLCCGAPRELGQSYCEAHRRLAYQPRPLRVIAAQAAERLS